MNNYMIQSRNDFIAGSSLVTSIPEKDLDQNALNTIQADCPDFILPFHYKSCNDEIAFTYKVGAFSKLHYFSGTIEPDEYLDFWQSLLRPLLECSDWFMNPCSFILSSDYLYYDKSNKTVIYVYIPSVSGCSGYDTFNKMAVEVSKMIRVSDAVLENKVLRVILENFNPTDFLKMIKDHISENSEHSASASGRTAEAPPETQTHILATEACQMPRSGKLNSYGKGTLPCGIIDHAHNGEAFSESSNASLRETDKQENDAFDDIIINIKTDTKTSPEKKDRASGRYRIFSSKGKKKSDGLPSMPDKDAQNRKEHKGKPSKQPKVSSITQSTSVTSNVIGLRYIGYASLPQSIRIMISEGELFTIGRFDANIGKKQSSFEFDKKTKAVSRRHAVIERDIDGYKIIDLSSSAGTFVNEKKLPPNTPYALSAGCRVSFGNSGADYVWEVS